MDKYGVERETVPFSVHIAGEGFSTLQEKFSVHCSWEITEQCSAEGEYSAGGRLLYSSVLE